MKKHIKKNAENKTVQAISKKYGISLLESAIFARRKITTGNDILYYLENDTRFLHQPFCFNAMEDAVERIHQAIEENEKILIFGDKDVDGISATAILYTYLKKRGADVQWRLPVGEDAYGLSIDAVNDLAQYAGESGALIITVDCGISNYVEIQRANELGIDTIITDHHNPPETVPDAIIILNPKMDNSGYPYKDISGAALAYKLVSALRFSSFQLYNQDFCLMTVTKQDEAYIIDCLKIRNLVKKSQISVVIDEKIRSIYDTPLLNFLSGQQILVWDEKSVKSTLKELFGSSIDFQMMDMRPKIAHIIPAVNNKALSDIKNLSKIARYSEKPVKEIDGFYNLFVTFAEKSATSANPQYKNEQNDDLQLVAIAALADIMPLKDENRIFVKEGLNLINNGKIRKGLAELIARSDLQGRRISSTDLSWKIIPSLNAAGRLGKSNLSLELLISENPIERNQKADIIKDLNAQRKIYLSDAEFFTAKQAEDSFKKYNEKLCIVYDERIFKGITGLLANYLVSKYEVPAIAISFSEDKTIASGSMRTCRSLIATDFLDKFGEGFFINHGGHNAAAGFSFTAEKLDAFLEKAQTIISGETLEEKDGAIIEIDAELPSEYITPEILKTIDKFEPFGEENPEIIFFSKNLSINNAIITGKTERQHLKLILNCGKYKFPAMYWGEAERLGRDFSSTDKLDILYKIERNYYNGNCTPQMIIIDAEPSKN